MIPCDNAVLQACADWLAAPRGGSRQGFSAHALRHRQVDMDVHYITAPDLNCII